MIVYLVEMEPYNSCADWLMEEIGESRLTRKAFLKEDDAIIFKYLKEAENHLNDYSISILEVEVGGEG